jgi:lathosterol oxidase
MHTTPAKPLPSSPVQPTELMEPSREILSSLTTMLGNWPGLVATDLARYMIGAGLVFLIVNGLLAGSLRRRKIRKDSAGWSQIKREVLASIRTVFILSLASLLIGTSYIMGWLHVYEDPAAMGWGYFAFSVIAIILLHDTWFYWTHRLIHDPRLFRRFHRLHHKSHNPTPWTAYAFDSGEAAINALFLPVTLFILPISFLAIFVFTSHMIIRNALAHCGYEIYPANKHGKPLFDWMTTVTHHDMHHASAGYNYGFYFTWWDRWLGTEHPKYLAEFKRVSPSASSRATHASQA